MRTIRKDGSEVSHGDVVTDFRGIEWAFIGPTRANARGKSGKVLVSSHLNGTGSRQEFYDTVFDLTVIGDLPASAIGETNPHTGHLVIDQRGDVVLAWREREGKADYAVWRLFVTHDGLRGFDNGDYYNADQYGENALAHAAEAFRTR